MFKIKIFRLYTESVGDESVSDEIMRRLFPGYTKIHAEGYCDGIGEKSVVYEIVCKLTFIKGALIWDKLKQARQEIKQRNKQQSVLLTATDGTGGF